MTHNLPILVQVNRPATRPVRWAELLEAVHEYFDEDPLDLRNHAELRRARRVLVVLAAQLRPLMSDVRISVELGMTRYTVRNYRLSATAEDLGHVAAIRQERGW